MPETRYAQSGDLSIDRMPDLARYERQTASPGAAAEILQHNTNMDVRYALPSVQVPTLVLHRTGDPIVNLDKGQYLTDHIAGAQMKTFPGDWRLWAAN